MSNKKRDPSMSWEKLNSERRVYRTWDNRIELSLSSSYADSLEKKGVDVDRHFMNAIDSFHDEDKNESTGDTRQFLSEYGGVDDDDDDDDAGTQMELWG